MRGDKKLDLKKINLPPGKPLPKLKLKRDFIRNKKMEKREENNDKNSEDISELKDKIY